MKCKGLYRSFTFCITSKSSASMFIRASLDSLLALKNCKISELSFITFMTLREIIFSAGCCRLQLVATASESGLAWLLKWPKPFYCRWV